MKLNRKARTLTYLIPVTIFCGVVAKIPYLAAFSFFTSVIFGLALAYSNKEYLKYKFSAALIIISFFIIFLFGTLPFYVIGAVISSDFGIIQTFGFFGAFVLVMLVVKFLLLKITFNVFNIILLVIFSVIATMLLSLAVNHNAFDLERADTFKKLGYTITITQFLMSIFIVSMMERNESIK